MAGYEQKHSVVNVAENSESYFKVKLSVDREYNYFVRSEMYRTRTIKLGPANQTISCEKLLFQSVFKILDFSQRKKKDCGVCSWVLVDLKQHPTGYEIFLVRSISEEGGGGGGGRRGRV